MDNYSSVLDQEVSVLNELGLTDLQARTYLSLVKLGKAAIKIISTATQIDRSETYGTVFKLQKLGLVEQIVSVPNVYKPIPLKQALSILVKRKKEEYNKIKKKTDILTSKYEIDQEKIENTPDEESFKILPPGERSLNEGTKKHKKAQRTFDLICTPSRFISFINFIPKLWAEDLKRGVRIRIIITKNLKCPRALLSLAQEPNFELRYLDAGFDVNGSCIDKKNLFVSVDPNLPCKKTPYYVTNNPSFLAMFNSYFEELWDKSQKIELL